MVPGPENMSDAMVAVVAVEIFEASEAFDRVGATKWASLERE